MLWLTAYTLMSSELLFDTRIVIVSGSSGMTECFTQPGNATTRSATTDARTPQRMSRRPVAAPPELRSTFPPANAVNARAAEDPSSPPPDIVVGNRPCQGP